MNYGNYCSIGIVCLYLFSSIQIIWIENNGNILHKKFMNNYHYFYKIHFIVIMFSH